MLRLESTSRSLARAAYKRSLAVQPLWRYGLNFRSTLAYRRSSSNPTGEAARTLRDLNLDGVAQTTLEAVTGRPELLASLQNYAAELERDMAHAVRSRSDDLASGQSLGNGREDKLFVVTLLDRDRPVIDPHGPLAGTALDPQVKAIADGYYAMRTRVTDLNIWRNLPSFQAPVASQLWHRDLRTDHLILKMFIYLEDVGEGNGPYSYVKGTHAKGGRRWQPRSTFDGYNWRGSDLDVTSTTTAAERPEFTGKAGTVVFTDTTGWHKGGHAITGPRLVMQVLFASPSALPDRRLGAPEGLMPGLVATDLAFEFTRPRSRSVR